MDTEKYKVASKRQVSLQDMPHWEDSGYEETEIRDQLIPKCVAELQELQLRLHAEEKKGVLVVLQAIDTAGKDEIITFIFSHLLPQGLKVTSTKKPSKEELKHDFLWRSHAGLPERGQIAIFNRSYYEDLIAPLVYGADQTVPLPEADSEEQAWEIRCRQVNDFERYLVESGFPVVKFFLYVSKEEQRKRLLDRMKTPERHWEFSFSDLTDREKWDTFQQAYEKIVNHTSTDHAPWYVLPADNDWYARYLAAEIMIEVLEKMDPQYPVMENEEREKLEENIKRLENNEI